MNAERTELYVCFCTIPYDFERYGQCTDLYAGWHTVPVGTVRIWTEGAQVDPVLHPLLTLFYILCYIA